MYEDSAPTDVPADALRAEPSTAQAIGTRPGDVALFRRRGRKAIRWVSANGTIVNSGGSATIHVIKPNLTTGIYCLQTTPNILSNYGAILATRQGPDLSPGFINANNGWGSTCNPYGGYGVFTSNASGTATDEAFVVVIP